MKNQCLPDSWSIYRLRVWITPFRDSRYRAADVQFRVTFYGLAGCCPIPWSAKARPAYIASNVLPKIARNGKSSVPRSIHSTEPSWFSTVERDGFSHNTVLSLETFDVKNQAEKWNNHRHIRWAVMPMAVCFIRAFIRFWGAVVVCHFRICNPIFHTPFLHHFGVESYGITWSYIVAVCAENTLKSRNIGIYGVILRYKIRWIPHDT